MGKRTLAKLTRPRLQGIVARERLFQRLDECRSRPFVWVGGPPGAGKTTLVVSYVEARRLHPVWYQVDAADRDPATFFSYLLEAAPAGRGRLPALQPEHAADLRGFSSRFFRHLLARLPQGSVLVFDGLHFAQDMLCEVLPDAAREVPEGSNVIVIARDDPPPQFAKLEVHGLLATLDWHDLRLTLEETSALATAAAPFAAEEVRALHEQCEGWAAGVRLMAEHRHCTDRVRGGEPPRERAALFGYFAAEIFDRLPLPSQSVLLHTSLLPEITPRLAEGLTGNARAWTVLEELNRRHLFVERLDDRATTFQYHALFREFLSARARQALAPAEFNLLQRRTAALLRSAGRPDLAVPLLAQAGDWVGAGRLILEEASRLLARGHSNTLQAWVQALPAWYVEANPRLLYCLGTAQLLTRPLEARATLERAYERFVASHNDLGQALSAAAVVQAYYFAFDEFLGLDRWIEALETALAKGLEFPSAESELHAWSMFQLAMAYRHPRHPALPRCAERILAMITRSLEVNQAVVSAALLLPCLDWFSQERARLLVGYVEGLLGSPQLSALNRVWWLLALVNHWTYEGERERLLAALTQARELAQREGLRALVDEEPMLRLFQMAARGGCEAGEEQIRQVVNTLQPHRRQRELLLQQPATELALHRGDLARAEDHARRGVQLARETGLRSCEMEMLALLAAVLLERAQPQAALDAAQAAREIAPSTAGDKLAFHHLLLEADARFQLGEHDAAAVRLREAFAIGREQSYLVGYHQLPQLMARLCARALAFGIEADYARRIVRARSLPPPSPDVGAEWPWTVKVYVLGSPRVLIDDAPVPAPSKAQKKPLELLKALVALGPRPIDQGLVAQELWPDSEGDAADSALRMTLHRLRGLLRNDACVSVREGKLRLDERLCWVDAWAFESACKALEQPQAAQPADAFRQQALRTLDLYRGHAFEGESPTPWMLPARERWGNQFVSLTRRLGAAEEARGAWPEAADVYRRAIEVEPVAEALYQRLMICCLERGLPAEAFSAYERCRDMLSAKLGLRPSQQTQELHRRIAEQTTRSA